MNTTELTAAAEKARERHEACRDQGRHALAAVTSARAALNTAEAARGAAERALDVLADTAVGDVAAPTEAAVGEALAALTAAESQVVWTERVVAAAHRRLALLQFELRESEAASTAATETARRAALHARVLDLAANS